MLCCFCRLESNDFATAEHMGTHIDAPAHMYKRAKRLDEIPLEDLIAPLVIIDVHAQVTRTSSLVFVTVKYLTFNDQNNISVFLSEN